jgi:hypothetical protein
MAQPGRKRSGRGAEREPAEEGNQGKSFIASSLSPQWINNPSKLDAPGALLIRGCAWIHLNEPFRLTKVLHPGRFCGWYRERAAQFDADQNPIQNLTLHAC